MTKLENYTKYIMAALTGLIVAALYSPIVLTIFYSFYKTRKGKVDWNSFSYEPYTKLIFEKQILESLMNSIYVGIVTVICSVVIGFYFANYYHTSKSKMKEFLQFIIFLLGVSEFFTLASLTKLLAIELTKFRASIKILLEFKFNLF